MKPTLKVAGKVDDEIMLFSASTIPKNVDAEVIIWKCEVYRQNCKKKSKKSSTAGDV